MYLDAKILETLKREAFIESIGASLRLSGSTISDETVKQLLALEGSKKQTKNQLEPSSKSDSDIREL